MSLLEYITHDLAFLVGLIIVILTLFSAISTFVLPRSSRSPLTRLVFRLLREVFDEPYERIAEIMVMVTLGISAAVEIGMPFDLKAGGAALEALVAAPAVKAAAARRRPRRRPRTAAR